MSARTTSLKDKDGIELYPKTITSVVYDTNGNELDTTLSNIDSEFSEISSNVSTISSNVSTISTDVQNIKSNYYKKTDTIDANTLQGKIPSDFIQTTDTIDADTLEGNAASAFVKTTDTIDADTLNGHVDTYFAKSEDIPTIPTNISSFTNDSGYITSSALTTYAPLASPSFTGTPITAANTNYTTAQLRNVIISTSDPSGGSNGDIWIKYTT